MKIIASIVLTFSLSILLVTGCRTTTTYNSQNMAITRRTLLVYETSEKSPEEIKDILLTSLSARKWTITSRDFPIKAYIHRYNQNAKISIKFSNNHILIDTTGSTLNEKEYVPIRYVDFLMKTVYRLCNEKNKAQR